MPEIEIRPIQSEDLENLSTFEHGYYSEYVWQMSQELDPESAEVFFRRIRLPRQVFVSYPRDRGEIFSDYEQAEAFLIAELNKQSVGYIRVKRENDSKVARVVDLVISAPMRRQGIASGLILAVMNLIANRQYDTLILEMQSKNDHAIKLATKLGFNFCGFRDHYFPNKELALFFSKFAR